MSDEALEAHLYPPPPSAAKELRPQPDWATIHRELKRPGVTLQLLWGEHRTAHPDGYGYSRFCELYRAWEGRLSPTMRQTHVAGERMFVDYAGTAIDVIDGMTGEVLRAQLFVAVLGASNYTYAEATWTQGLADWIGSHVRTLAFIGGVPAQTVSDNLKSGIAKACFYEPAVNRTYACGSAPRIDPYRHPSATRCSSPPLLRYGRVGAMNCSTAPLTEPDLRARIRLFGSIDHSASESWCDACGVLSSSQRVLSETSRPMNQDGG